MPLYKAANYSAIPYQALAFVVKKDNRVRRSLDIFFLKKLHIGPF